jgi:hypothetical protein
MRFWLEVISAGFAFSAAVLWLRSATVSTPKQFPIQVHVFNVPSNLVIGPTQSAYGESKELNELGAAIVKQSRYGAYAASCAAISALVQAMLIFLPCPPQS